MKTNYTILSVLLITCLGLSIANATMPTNSPTGSPQKDGIFYTYFSNMAKTTVLPNPFLSGFTSDYSISHSDGNNFIKGFLATLGGNPTDIVTGFDASGNMTKTTISTVTKKYLSDNAGAGSVGEGIIGFGPTGTPVYSKEIGYWNNVGGILTYNGGVQIGSMIPSGLNVVGNITVINTPSSADDLITKGYADTYMKDICVRFLGSWNDATATCSAGTIPGPSCVAHACTAAAPACGATTTGTSDSCGTVCTKTGPVCPTVNSCAATLPACNGVGCTTTAGTPSSVGQAWTKTGPNCKFTCNSGYTGANCEVPPIPKCYNVQITYNGSPVGPDYLGSAGSYAGTQRCFSNNYATQKSLTTCPSGVPNAPLASGGFTNNKCVYSFMGSDWWGHFACVETSCGPVTNSCAATLPACNGVGCTTTTGTPSSVDQAWAKGATSCGFSCTGGYTGDNCEIAPAGNCMSYTETWHTGGQGGNCAANIPGGYSVADNQPVWSSPTVTLNNTTPGYTGSVTFRCIDSDPPAGNIAAEWTYVSGSCDPIVVATCSDGVKNGTETGVDCGGSCGACMPSSPICEYSIKYSKGVYYDAESKVVPIGATHVHSLDTTYHWISSDLIVDESGANRKITCPDAKVDAVCGAAFNCTKGTLDPNSKEATSKESYPRGCYYDWYCDGVNGGAGLACHKTTGCFAGEELVTTPTGTTPIASLKVGDKVISYNESTQQFVENTIDKVIIHDGKSSPLHDFDTHPLVRLTTQVNGVKKQTQVTANHLYYSPDEDIYKEIKNFIYGERIRSIDGIGNVVSIMKLSDTPVVYNLHMVNKPNNYLVNGVVVHNEKAESCTGCTGASCDTTTAWDPVCVPNGSCSASSPACETTTYGVDNCGNACSKTGDSCSVVSTNGSCGSISVIGGGQCASGTPGPTFDFWGNPVSGWLEGCGASYTWTCEGTGFGTTASCSGNLHHGCGS